MTDFLRSSLKSDVSLLQETNDNLLETSGKMLRPMISLLLARAAGKPTTDSLRFAAACELLHNATLLHDDVADHSARRRGRPTVAAMLGPSAAVLVGDFWLARTVDLIMGAQRNEKAISSFARTLTDLSEGEMLQMEKASEADTTEEDYLRIIHDKTASLFETAGETGAVSAGATPEYLEAARRFSRNFGMAFQIKDDILDYAGTDALGKPVGNDVKEKKITLPLLEAMKGSGREGEIRSMMKEVDVHPEYCGLIHAFVKENGGIEAATACLDGYIVSAKEALKAFPDSRAKEYLAEIAEFNRLRQT